MRFHDVEFTEEEIRDFQKTFPYSKGANVLNRILQKYSEKCLAVLFNMHTSLDEVRFEQGHNDALSALVNEIIAFSKVDVEKMKAMDMAKEEDKGEEEEYDTGLVMDL